MDSPFFVYPWGAAPQSKVPLTDQLHVKYCFEDLWNECPATSRERTEEAKLVVRFLNACMLDSGYPFRLRDGHVSFDSDSLGWWAPLLSSTNIDGETMPYLVKVLLVMRGVLANGHRVFKAFLRAARKWEEDGKPFQGHLHLVQAIEVLSGVDSRDADGGGIYGHLPPEIDASIHIDGHSFKYVGDAAGRKAAKLGRRQVNIGQTINFDAREGSYQRDGTNEHHRSARMMHVEIVGGKIDTINAWTREVILQIPSKTKVGRPIPSRLLRVYESIINLAVGATHHANERTWGLQTTYVDHSCHTVKLGEDQITKFLAWYHRHVASAGIQWRQVVRGIRGTTLTEEVRDRAIWDSIDAYVESLVAEYTSTCWIGYPESMQPVSTEYLSRIRVISIILQTHRPVPQSSLPPIPLSHWGISRADVPDRWLIKVSSTGVVTEDKEAGAQRVVERDLLAKRSKERKEENARSQKKRRVYPPRKNKKPSQPDQPPVQAKLTDTVNTVRFSNNRFLEAMKKTQS